MNAMKLYRSNCCFAAPISEIQPNKNGLALGRCSHCKMGAGFYDDSDSTLGAGHNTELACLAQDEPNEPEGIAEVYVIRDPNQVRRENLNRAIFKEEL